MSDYPKSEGTNGLNVAQAAMDARSPAQTAAMLVAEKQASRVFGR